MTLKPPSARSIGLFVVGALALAVTGLIAFGATSYFEHRPRAVTFFHGSVAGLAAGAPVTFRGVPVGKVVDIALQINSATGAAHIPVIMEFEPGRITVTGDAGAGSGGVSKSMLAAGLAASLVMQSFITGQLAIELDYHPAADETLTGIDLRLPEIPEARGGLSAMKDTIAKLPLQELANDAVATLHSVRELVSAPEIRDILRETAAAAKSAAAVAAVAEAQAPGMSKDARDAAAAAAKAAGRAEVLMGEIQPKLAAALADLDKLLGAGPGGAGQVVADVHALLAPRSPLLADIQTLVRNLATASGALRSFADQIERNPNALFMGRSQR
ncbi:MAG: MlaD family protein [Rhodospirillaceae bacterium]